MPDSSHAAAPAGSRSTRPDGIAQPLTAGAFVRNAWYMAGWVDHFRQAPLTHRTMLDEPIVIYRTDAGAWVALEDRCAHRFVPLSRGQIIDGCRVQCPYHGLQYDATGACVINPHGSQRIPARARVRAWPVIERHKALWIWMGEEAPRAAEVPDFSVLDAAPELHVTPPDGILVRANYQLVIDNLLDLSHTSFVHEGLLGNQGMTASAIECATRGTEVTVDRHASAVAPPGMFAPMWPGHPPLVDSFTHMRWMAPSTLRLMTGICEPGADPASGTGYHGLHMLPPATAGTTHYFFAAVRFGVRTPEPEFNREMQARISRLRRFAFEEQDAPVIESQQAVLDAANRTLDPVLLEVDAGPAQYKRVLARMLTREAAAR